MAKPKKQPRPKAETPKGFRDYFGAEVTERVEMLEKIAEVYRLHGFDPLETSAVETVEALGKYLPDVDRPNAGVFAFEEDDTWLALRYDLTAPLARVAAQYRNDLPFPYRRYAMGPVWRNEKPGPGRFRQFYQCDADTVGAPSVAADAEICGMLADTLEAVGIPRGDYIVRVNNRKVLNGVLEVAGLSGDDKEEERGIVLRAIDKLDRLGEDGVRALLGKGREDESGDFTKGAGLGDAQADVIMGFMAAKQDDGAATVARLQELVAGSEIGAQGVQELETITELLAAAGYGPDRIVIDPSVVRGLGYYTGPVYEAELTFEILDEKGRPRQFGSVAGGGRYDDLVKRFTGQEVPATGVSIGVDRLLAALRAKGRLSGQTQGPVIVTVMDRDRMAEYQAMATTLRQAGIRAEVYLGNPKNFGNQLKYADKRASPVAVIQGSDEAARGVVQLKDLILGAKLAQDATLEEWKSQPAQVEVSLVDLVAEVRKLLGPPPVSDKPAIRAEAARLLAYFEAAGAIAVEADLLLPADTLLDLYGEDIRARAYVTHDPDRGELMLRPDFTVPVVQRHMETGAEPARYTYQGEVFRTQTAGSGRPSEYLQVGYELFQRDDPVRADAEVFALFSEVLSPAGLRAVTGDIGILLAAIDSLSTTDARKAALRRHVWRPRRFRALIERYTGRAPVPPARAALIEALQGHDTASLIAEGGPEIGLRSAEEVTARIAALVEDAVAPPIPAAEAEVLGAILSLKAALPDACEHLRDVCVDLPGLGPAVEVFAARIAALEEAGIDTASLPFEASYGRTTMEYYDGFVFGFLAGGRADLPPVATGGRYDALTRILGGGRAIPAVGGVIRPELLHLVMAEAVA